MKDLTFRLDGYTHAAGKYNPGAVRDGNEDAFFVDLDLSGKTIIDTAPNALLTLGDYGTIMAVADGMGGMNAGEVASQIAIDTVRAAFQPSAITPQITDSPESRAAYLENVLRRANQNIIDNATANPSRSGMGSTLIMAWLMPSGELTLTWIGDSRAYVYNPQIGIHPLSEDQSFVQQLVKKGLITYEQSFDHPQNNIIMHSLGDASQPCAPETRQFNVGKGDIILLCSDGLSGVLRDRPGKNPLTGKPYEEENIQEVIKDNYDSVSDCRKALFQAAERGKWYDNVTVIVCRIVDGPKSKVKGQVEVYERQLAQEVKKAKSEMGDPAESSAKTKKLLIFAIIALVILGIVGWVAFYLLSDKEETDNEKSKIENVDQAAESEDISADDNAAPSPEMNNIVPPSAKEDASTTADKPNPKENKNPQSDKNSKTGKNALEEKIKGTTTQDATNQQGMGRQNDLKPSGNQESQSVLEKAEGGDN